MDKTNMKTILDFLGFERNDLKITANLIKVSKILNCEHEMRTQLIEFDQRFKETKPEFYRRIFLSELSWQLTRFVCNEYYPHQAIKDIDDFGLFFQDYWLDNENKNDFYEYFLSNDLTNKTKREIVEQGYEKLNKRFETFFHNI